MADNTQKMSYKAGETKGQAQEKASNLMDRADNAAQSAKESVQEEKASNLMDRADNAAQSAKESVQEAGQQVRAKTQEAVEGVKNATGMNK
ncbi:PREDICTED: late embryogenesis abundant protein 1-like [Populus euphratica]|uniref:Late embryogenesis abundant protein 1-like n=1 Tax=Populus euphratica TaxID=75702 RepID=A0AAJ6THL1_POPEU|nr:PREDICTED: late embryogenesis abundant protein 1-like [Populus euphratica]